MRIVIILFLFLMGIAPLPAQESYPIPEQLAIGVRENEVRISWQIPDDYDRRFFLFVHTQLIDPETVSEAQLIAVLPAGSSQYTEQITQPGEYHFAVVTERENREPSQEIQPGRNATQRAVTVGIDDPSPAAPSGEILSLRTITQGNQARVSIRTDSDEMGVTVIRTLQPPAAGPLQSNTYHVAAAVQGSNLQITDDLVPGVGVYYTAMETDTFERSEVPELRPGVNTSRTAVQTAGTPAPRVVEVPYSGGPDSRRRALPDVQIENTLLSGVRLPPPALERAQRATLDDETQLAVTRILSRFTADATLNTPTLDARPDEREIDELNDSYLRQFVSLWLRSGATQRTNSYLRYFIASNTDPASIDRARFFLGRSEYELGNYREALYQFLLTEDTQVPQSRVWLRAALDAMSFSP